jgi:hypothetical protein
LFGALDFAVDLIGALVDFRADKIYGIFELNYATYSWCKRAGQDRSGRTSETPKAGRPFPVRWLCFLLALGATIFATMIALRQPPRPNLARHQA